MAFLGRQQTYVFSKLVNMCFSGDITEIAIVPTQELKKALQILDVINLRLNPGTNIFELRCQRDKTMLCFSLFVGKQKVTAVLPKGQRSTVHLPCQAGLGL